MDMLTNYKDTYPSGVDTLESIYCDKYAILRYYSEYFPVDYERTLTNLLMVSGVNDYGQLGLGDTYSQITLTPISNFIEYSNKFDLMYEHLFQIKSDGTIWSCGNGTDGRLGNSSVSNLSSLTQVGVDTNWSKVSCGYDVTHAIKTTGTLWTCGRYGTNIGITASSTSLRQIGTAADWATVSCGYNHSLGIKNNGYLWAWGLTTYGQLGNSTNTGVKSTPVQIGSLTTWSNVVASTYVSFGITTDYKLYTWGRNNYGQLGLGDITNRSSPVQVGSLTNWSQVSCNGETVSAVKTDGTLWTWGRNTYGQLGLGDIAHRSSPVQVGSLTDWSQVSSGNTCTFAIKTDGTLWSWGRAFYLGDNSVSPRSSPVQVGSLTDWKKVVCGNTSTIAYR